MIYTSDRRLLCSLIGDGDVRRIRLILIVKNDFSDELNS